MLRHAAQLLKRLKAAVRVHCQRESHLHMQRRCALLSLILGAGVHRRRQSAETPWKQTSGTNSQTCGNQKKREKGLKPWTLGYETLTRYRHAVQPRRNMWDCFRPLVTVGRSP